MIAVGAGLINSPAITVVKIGTRIERASFVLKPIKTSMLEVFIDDETRYLRLQQQPA